MFCNFNGKGYMDNPKYIDEYLFHQRKHVDFVWIIKNSENRSSISSNISIVNLDSINQYVSMLLLEFGSIVLEYLCTFTSGEINVILISGMVLFKKKVCSI